MNLLQLGSQELTPRVAEHLESCLGCLGCQTVCPSGVSYVDLLEEVRPSLAQLKPWLPRTLMRAVFSGLLPNYLLLQFLGAVLRLWQLGPEKVFDNWRPFGKVLGPFYYWQSLLPRIPKFKPLPYRSWLSKRVTSELEKQIHGEVNLFSGCIMNVFYNQVNHACLRVLLSQGQIVNVGHQVCCGALAAHAGEVDITRALAKRNIELMETNGNPIVVTAAGCGAMLKRYPALFAESEPEWRQRAQAFAGRVSDITEFLCQHDFPKVSAPLNYQVAYHAACHLYHAQGVHDAPLKLLERISGLHLIPLTDAEHCCGSAGVYNLTHRSLSEKVLALKISAIAKTGAQIVVTTNPGCMLQLEAGAKSAGLAVTVKHLVELLDEAYCQNL